MELTIMRTISIEKVEYQLLNDKNHLIVRRTLPKGMEVDPYRWAVKTNTGWKVYIGNTYQMSIGGNYERVTPEDVARKIYVADKNQ